MGFGLLVLLLLCRVVPALAGFVSGASPLGFSLLVLLLVGGLVPALAGVASGASPLGFGLLVLLLVGLQHLCAALAESVAAAEFGHRLVGLQPVLLAFLTEMTDDLLVQRFGPFDGDVLELPADAGRTQRGVPIGMDGGSGDGELVA